MRGGLLGHAVVADHRVEAPPGVGVLGGVVGLQRGRDASLVLQGATVSQSLELSYCLFLSLAFMYFLYPVAILCAFTYLVQGQIFKNTFRPSSCVTSLSCAWQLTIMILLWKGPVA